ncbi:hypothetical protein [Amphibacillus sediminis]|uniref:hypothetical protein n=1 Tax=Amphibacillus sediminis TaxID=360185 RepID=UPI00082E6EFB|nr:hypothetical protein [Amphibacillus sediminis]
MSTLAILAAGLFFFFAACISLFLFIKGYGKTYLAITFVTLVLVYFIIGIWNEAPDNLTSFF